MCEQEYSEDMNEHDEPSDFEYIRLTIDPNAIPLFNTGERNLTEVDDRMFWSENDLRKD